MAMVGKLGLGLKVCWKEYKLLFMANVYILMGMSGNKSSFIEIFLQRGQVSC